MSALLRNIAIIIFLSFFSIPKGNSQIICVFCYDQNDSISDYVTNYITNGSFEINSCGSSGGYYCPASSSYSCDIAGWTCSGGGPATYAQFFYSTPMVVDGIASVYLGNSFCSICSGGGTGCISEGDSCAIDGVMPGYPNSNPGFGGTSGVSLSQTVTGLIPGQMYILEFWSGGEDGFPNHGVFGVDVGFGYLFLANHETGFGDIGIRYLIEFKATSSTHTIKFTNWGHICFSCTEAVLDDVRLYHVSDLDPSIPICVPSFLSSNAFGTNISCFGANDGSAWLSFGGGVPPYSINWTPGGATTDTVTNLGPGIYYVTLVDSNGTTFTDSVLITQPNVLSVDATTPVDTICQGSSTTLNTVATGGTGAYSYQWSTNPGDTLSSFSITPTSSGYINVIVTDSNGCTAIDSIYIMVMNYPVITVGPDTCICYGESVTLFATGSPSFIWNNGANTNFITVSPPVDSTYIVSSNNGYCESSDTAFICVYPLPMVVASNDTSVQFEFPANLNVYGPGPFNWTPPTALNCTNCTNPVANPDLTTTYTVTSTNSFGCTASDQVTVEIFYVLIIPNIFTPNGDGINDVFKITSLPPNSAITIYNRWGNELYTTESYKNNWTTGTDGVYYYVLHTPDGKDFSGFFHVTGN